MSENVKTLLVIGNGFDLAHELKTKYTDFLDFVTNKIPTGQSGFFPKDYKIGNFVLFESDQSKNKLSLDDLKKCIDSVGNIWIGHFNQLKITNDFIGKNWIDFETEIENVIKKIEKRILNEMSPDEWKSSNLERIMGGYFNQSAETISQEFVPRISWDLKILKLLLEQYLIEEEKNLKANHNLFFKNLKPDVVISYNYTHTFQKLYDPDEKIPVHFIHGELGKHNLVLGIGETLSGDEKNNFTVCASFKKFFQRIKYRLKNQYRENITQFEDRFTHWQIVIYGHSLDATDKDSLSWLMKNWEKEELIDGSQPIKRIFIHYHDENTYNQQIANAMQIVGKDELIDSVNSGRIVFSPLNDLINLAENFKGGELWNLS